MSHAAGVSDMAKKISLDLIDESPTNPRKTFRGLEELADNIKQHGLLQAVLLRPKGDRFELVFGARRYRASKLASLETIRANVRDLDDRAVIEIQLIENGKRDDIHPLEEADGFRVLHETHGYSVDDLAAKLGKSKAFVYSRLKFCSLCDKGRKAFLEGDLTAATALMVARIPDLKVQEKAVDELCPTWSDGPLSVQRATDIVQRRFMLHLEEAKFDREECRTCPRRTGTQPELFADVESPDMCTDPKCFDAKVEDHWRKVTAEAKKSGQTVLSKAESKEAFGSGTYLSSTKFVDLDATCHQDAKGRTWRDLTGKAVTPVLARDGAGRIRELLPATDAKKLAKKTGKLQPQPKYAPTESDKHAAATAKREAEKKQANRVAFIDGLCTAAEAIEPTPAFWRLLIDREIDMAGEREDLAKRLGCPDDIEEQDWIDREIDRMTSAQLRGVLMFLLCADTYSESMSTAAALYGVEVPDELLPYHKRKAYDAGAGGDGEGDELDDGGLDGQPKCEATCLWGNGSRECDLGEGHSGMHHDSGGYWDDSDEDEPAPEPVPAKKPASKGKSKKQEASDASR